MNKKIKDKNRFIGAIVYFIAGMLLLVFVLARFGFDFIFYNDAVIGFDNYPRFIWCLACVFMGFSAIAYRASLSEHKDKQGNYKTPFPYYFTSYLLVLILASSIDFAFFHIFDSTSNYLFYFLAGPVGFVLGYHADQAKINPLGLFSILKPW